MAMELKQSLKLTQQLVMTPQLQQAIKLLQLSRMELLEQVREEMETEPPPRAARRDRRGQPRREGARRGQPRGRERRGPPGRSSRPRPRRRRRRSRARVPPEIDWDAYLNSYQFNEPTTASNKGNVATEDLPSFEANLVEEGGPRSTTSQAQLGHAQAERRRAPDRLLILGNLDDDGYLKLPDVEGDPLIRLANEADVPSRRRARRCGRSSSSSRRAAARATCRSAC